MEWDKYLAVFKDVVEAGLSADLDAHWRERIKDAPYFSISVYRELDRDGLALLVEIAQRHDVALEIDQNGTAQIGFPYST